MFWDLSLHKTTRAYVIAVVLCTTFFVPACVDRQISKQTPQMQADSRFWIRVLIVEKEKSCQITPTSSFQITYPDSNVSQIRFNKSKNPVTVEIVKGRISIGGQIVSGNRFAITTDSPHILAINGSQYRGKFVVILDEQGPSFDLINIVPLEPYLAGVIGAEMPDYWEMEALKAQAIAARTYCLYIKKRFGAKRNWDVRKSQANQVYKGVSAESKRVWTAVNQTYGHVLVCPYDGRQDIFPSYYSSTCGGHTENSQNVFGDSFVTLQGVPCPYCKGIAKPKYYFWPMLKLSKEYVSQKLIERYPQLEKLGRINTISPIRQSDYENYSRLTMIKLKGENGKTDAIRAEDLRLTLDPTGMKIKSTIFKIVSMGADWAFVSGRGYGHGVGMCQCGAQGLAREGKTAEYILSYYYPGSSIVNLY